MSAEDREVPLPSAGCLWHTHSLFARCPNGLTLTEYLTIAAIHNPKQAGEA